MRALITGASSGIGKEMARLLSAQGWELILVARRRDRLEELQRELPTESRIVCMDISSEAACRELYESCRETPVDALINNAGFGVFGPFEEVSLEQELAMIDLNIRTLHVLTKLFYADFKQRNSGYILNVASCAAFLSGPLMSTYYASKAYVLRLTTALYEEARREADRVKISALCPGPVQTEFDEVAGVKFRVSGMKADKVAKIAVRGMLRGRPVIVPGCKIKLAKLATRIVPDKLLYRIAWHIQSRKG